MDIASTSEGTKKKRMGSIRSNRWVFTINNPGEFRPVYDAATMLYLIYELEHSEGEGTEHLQGYVRFDGRVALSTAKARIHAGAHMEPSKGTEEDNRKYCSKEGRAQEFGVFDGSAGQQGRRTDLEEVTSKIQKGIVMKQIALDHPETFVKYHAGLERMSMLITPLPPVKRDLHTTLLWGPTGVGKSHRIQTEVEDIYSTVAGPHCWDMYSSQDSVFLDEFDPMQVPIEDLNSWLDCWRVQLRCRYNNKWAVYTQVYIATNTDPSGWYLRGTQTEQAKREAVLRRLSPPMGMIYHVESQTQKVDLKWWCQKQIMPISSDLPIQTNHQAQEKTSTGRTGTENAQDSTVPVLHPVSTGCGPKIVEPGVSDGDLMMMMDELDRTQELEKTISLRDLRLKRNLDPPPLKRARGQLNLVRGEDPDDPIRDEDLK